MGNYFELKTGLFAHQSCVCACVYLCMGVYICVCVCVHCVCVYVHMHLYSLAQPDDLAEVNVVTVDIPKPLPKLTFHDFTISRYMLSSPSYERVMYQYWPYYGCIMCMIKVHCTFTL